MAYENILVDTKGPVGLITLNRPDALNALNAALMQELAQARDEFEGDERIGAIVLTGSDKSFAAGADVNEMQPKDFMDVFNEDFITAGWERLARCRKPVIAAVAGYALGGRCEVAMLGDVILAADSLSSANPRFASAPSPGSAAPSA